MANDVVLDKLFKEVRRSYELLKKGAEVIHKRGETTAGMRGIVEVLFDEGSLSVAHIAKLKHVSRQSVQVLVNQMLKLGWVQSHPNPFHKKSVLIGLTEKGKKAFLEMKKKEAEHIRNIKFDIGTRKLDEVSFTLVELNKQLSNYIKSRE